MRAPIAVGPIADCSRSELVVVGRHDRVRARRSPGSTTSSSATARAARASADGGRPTSSRPRDTGALVRRDDSGVPCLGKPLPNVGARRIAGQHLLHRHAPRSRTASTSSSSRPTIDPKTQPADLRVERELRGGSRSERRADAPTIQSSASTGAMRLRTAHGPASTSAAGSRRARRSGRSRSRAAPTTSPTSGCSPARPRRASAIPTARCYEPAKCNLVRARRRRHRSRSAPRRAASAGSPASTISSATSGSGTTARARRRGGARGRRRRRRPAER